MKDLNRTTYFYRINFKRKEAHHNKSRSLPEYFGQMIGNKKTVRIAELGAGPINTIGDHWDGVAVDIAASDVMQPEYEQFWKHHGKTPIVPIVFEDMEHLSYSDESFDIVHCVNALDHTENADIALREFERICKPGGWIYLRHAPYQMRKYRGMHRWNIHMTDGGECVFEGKQQTFVLSDGFSTHVEGEFIISMRQKS